MPIFEFFSGIGGMHKSFRLINSSSSQINLSNQHFFPFDVNPNANSVYYLNFNILPSTKTLEYLYLDEYEQLCRKYKEEFIIWTMSPPCQPFTSQGLQRDLNDSRTFAFQHLVKNVLNETKYRPHFFILENVKNFEYSNANALLLKTLKKRKYNYLQFLLSPDQIGIPNRRLRYFLLAVHKDNSIVKDEFRFLAERCEESEEILTSPHILSSELIHECPTVESFLGDLVDKHSDREVNKKYYLTEYTDINKKLLDSEFKLHHVCNLESRTTNCFTKSYGKKFKGSGSILNLGNESHYPNREDYIGNLRYFSPEEMLKFFDFPINFKFPAEFSPRDKYKLIGNSINIRLVSKLLKFLIK